MKTLIAKHGLVMEQKNHLWLVEGNLLADGGKRRRVARGVEVFGKPHMKSKLVAVGSCSAFVRRFGTRGRWAEYARFLEEGEYERTAGSSCVRTLCGEHSTILRFLYNMWGPICEKCQRKADHYKLEAVYYDEVIGV